MHINGSTRIVAILGCPIAHTASPAMHNAAFDALNLNLRYVAFHVEPSHLKSALQGLAAAGVVGVNLTVPHKILAVRFLNNRDQNVQQLGAANVIRFSRVGHQSHLQGFNTDGYGLLKALREEFSFQPRGKTVAILGCGGAGQSAAVQLALAGARKLILLNRTRSKASAVIRRIRALKLPTQCGCNQAPCDLVIQATSLGLRSSDPLPISARDLRLLNPEIFFEMIYHRAETPVMRLARKFGYRVVNGLGMLLHQGAKAFEIWTGRKAPVEVMRRALQREMAHRT